MGSKKTTLMVILIGLFLPDAVQVASQNKIYTPIQNKEFDRYSTDFLSTKTDTVAAMKTALLWIKAAKAAHLDLEKVKAYKALMHSAKKEYRMIYADSLIAVARDTKEDDVIGGAYLTVGAAYYNQKNNAKALENYLKAQTFISKKEDPYLSHKITYAVAQTNYHLGYYHEAIALFRKCIAFFKDESDEAYLRSVHGIGLSYHQIARYDLSSYNNQLGIKFSQEKGYAEMIPYFNNSEGFNKYRMGKYDASFNLLAQSLPEVKLRKDYTTEALTLLYMGKYWITKEKHRKANDYFIRVNQIITDQQIIHPYLRENFELLITFYKNNQNVVQRQYYCDKLLEFDKRLSTEFKNLAYKMHKEYNTINVTNQKDNTIPVQKTNVLFFSIGASFLGLAGLFVIRIKYKIKKRKHLVKNAGIPKRTAPTVVDYGPLKKISAENQQLIMIQLEKFENSKKFLSKGITLSWLAVELGTNSRYVSAIIAYYRGKNVTKYLNDSKIDYLVHLLLTDPELRKYTNEVLAEKIGFGSTQIFTKAFNYRMNKSPNQFISELKNKEL
jgi:AraC-like DNA-binding protein